MTWQVKYDPEHALIECSAIGYLTTREIKDASLKATSLSREMKTNLILIDDSQVDETIETLDIYELPKFYEELNISRKIKVAVILPDNPKAREDVMFFETVCRNRGWNIFTFSTRKEAIEWLTTASKPEKPDGV